jgi:hypothetical protein
MLSTSSRKTGLTPSLCRSAKAITASVPLGRT